MRQGARGVAEQASGGGVLLIGWLVDLSDSLWLSRYVYLHTYKSLVLNVCCGIKSAPSTIDKDWTIYYRNFNTYLKLS